jgi:hypothetical protein
VEVVTVSVDIVVEVVVVVELVTLFTEGTFWTVVVEVVCAEANPRARKLNTKGITKNGINFMRLFVFVMFVFPMP